MTSIENKTKSPSSIGWMITLSLLIVAVRIATVSSPAGDTAFLSANDRSRWCTLACLVERGTYEIDEQIAITDPVHRNRRPWDTIDKVRHTNDDGELKYYSSKPPLFPTLVAGVYWVVHHATGLTMTQQPLVVPRVVLGLVNLPLLWILLVTVTDSIGRLTQSDWAKKMAVGAACFATMLLPFSISLNNHLPAAVATAVVGCLYLRRQDAKSQQPLGRWDFLAGAAAAFAFTNELPALSMLVFWILLFTSMDARSLKFTLSGAITVIVLFLGCNWIAHQSFRPPYAHRGNGPLIATLTTNDPVESETVWQQTAAAINQELGSQTTIQWVPSDESGRWRIETPRKMFGLIQVENGYEIRHWDDWYEYPGSYWQDGRRTGVDLGESSRWMYLFHMTFGHHGIFSLTPIWLLMPVGYVIALKNKQPTLRRFAVFSLLATLVCATFYVLRPTIDRNYGGVSVCFRWLLWFAPMWLVMVAVALDRWSSHRPFRLLSWALLALSVASMLTGLASPWQHPWLYRG